MKKTKLAIIIPTKNEEYYLKNIADSIIKQTYTNYKVFVADAYSSDKTVQIAESYGFTVVPGGTPSVGRNNGAQEALKWGADLLLFVDADVVLTGSEFLEKAIEEMKHKNLDVAGTLQEPYMLKEYRSIIPSRNLLYKTVVDITNLGLMLFEKSKKPLMQVCMFATAQAYVKVNGFKPLIFGEDSQFSMDAKKMGFKFGIIRKCGKVLLSMRRFSEKGLIKSRNLYFVKEMLLGHMYTETDAGNLSFRYFD